MSRQAHNSWVVLSPPFSARSEARRAFREHALRLAALVASDADDDAMDDALEEARDSVRKQDRSTKLVAALSILTDLARQRWLVRVSDAGDVEVQRPAGERLDPRREKARIRNQELVKRNEQLREPATRKFIESVISSRAPQLSVYSLLRDGRELAASLREVRALPRDKRADALRAVVDPYLQFVDSDERCAQTDLRLQDIWRYFRHTWTNQYVSTPGRTMAFLVRDRSQRHHPVIGIGALGSPIVQIRERDAWIGWHPDAFMEFVTESPSAELGVWLTKTIDTAVNEIYVSDLYAEDLLSAKDLHAPTAKVVERLIAYGDEQREKHHRFVNSPEMKRELKRERDDRTDHWRARAESHLYKSKRALTLADMLRSRIVLRKYLSRAPTLDEVKQLLQSADGSSMVKKVLRKAKADRVGIAMADITVCGAVAPYSPILGGKLVSMLAASPEVVDAYQRRYLEQESEIASSMAGRPIVRPSELVFLGTTSLYGIGSSQYNRLYMPAELIGGRPGERLEYLEIGRSEAYGTSHFTKGTVDALVKMVQQSSNGQRVNSIFGEGVSPKLRKLRDGLDQLNFPTDALLQHGRERIVYGVPLARNLREYLLGMDASPDYIFSAADPKAGTAAISSWWMDRWLSPRIESDEVLAQVERHATVRDGRYLMHGACVRLPSVEELQPALFDDINL
ncbi:Druantia anti-phage system protein DruA [Corallococcus exercitus]|uniref:Druantia anti-phage system protein DruA n=1 Tax=Corallococcus exercitus TaxID=2316736 RepID=UPI0035D43720